jgi:PD-(D/E)XK nuclease superfamily
VNWSLSKLGTFTKCRRRFLYSYIQHLKGTEQPRGARERGVDQHAHIERYFTDSTPLPADLASYTPWFDMLRGLEHHAEMQLAMLAGWVPCAWEDPAAWWKGVLDLLVLHGRTAWVFDWKTGKVYPDHVDQKELYAIATFKAYEDIEEIEAWHLYLDLGKKTKEIYTRDQLPTLIAKWNVKLAPYVQALERYVPGEAETFFVTNPSYLCDYCPYSRNPCPH